MRRSSKLAISIVLTLVVAGFGWAAGRGETEGYRVAYVARTQGDPFAVWMSDSVREVAEGYEDLSFEFFDGQAQNELVNEHIENAITRGYDAILLHANDPVAHVSYVHEALDAGIEVVTVNTIIQSDRVPQVDADPYEQGAVNARYAVDLVPQNGKAVVLLGPAGNFHSEQRHKAWRDEFFAVRPDVEILDTQIGNWNKDQGLNLMEDWITAYGREISVIVSMNDGMVLGALEAYRARGEEIPLAFGVDGTAEAALAIAAGDLTSTSLQSAYDLGELGVEVVYQAVSGQNPDPIVIRVGNPLYTLENVEELLNIHRRRGAID